MQESVLSHVLYVSSELEDDAYNALVEVIRLYESLKLKGQRASKKTLKENASQKAIKLSFPYSKLRCLRGDITNTEIMAILNKVIKLELSLVEMEQESCRIKEMRSLQNFFVKKTECDSWQDAKERHVIYMRNIYFDIIIRQLFLFVNI